LLNITTVSFLLAKKRNIYHLNISILASKGTGEAGQIELEEQYFFFYQVMFSPSTLLVWATNIFSYIGEKLSSLLIKLT
jgi:hypothetical protein